MGMGKRTRSCAERLSLCYAKPCNRQLPDETSRPVDVKCKQATASIPLMTSLFVLSIISALAHVLW
jgi:hypothetical protein